MSRVLENALVFLACAAFPTVLVAQEGDEPGAEAEEHAHKNHLALFLGATQAGLDHGERDDPEFTIGLDYERRLTQVVGVGVLLDVVVEGHREGIIGVPLFLHAGQFTFQLAPGGERVRESGDWSFIARFGALYELEVGTLTISPALFYDLTEEEGTWVGGFTIGKGF